MAIKQNKSRLVIVLENTLLQKIKKLAEQEKRSMSNMAAIILDKYFEENK